MVELGWTEWVILIASLLCTCTINESSPNKATAWKQWNAGATTIPRRPPVHVHPMRYYFIGETSADAIEEYKERVSAHKWMWYFYGKFRKSSKHFMWRDSYYSNEFRINHETTQIRTLLIEGIIIVTPSKSMSSLVITLLNTRFY